MGVQVGSLGRELRSRMWGTGWIPGQGAEIPYVGVQVGSLGRELRSHMPHNQEAQAWNRSDVITGSVKTLEMVHIKKKNNKNKKPQTKAFHLKLSIVALRIRDFKTSGPFPSLVPGRPCLPADE